MFYILTCSIAREVELPQDERFTSRFHLGLDYRPNVAKAVIGDRGDASANKILLRVAFLLGAQTTGNRRNNRK
jgi:hypothetical protein